MRIKQAVAEIGKTDSEVIIIHAGANNLNSNSTEKLASEVMETFQQVQQNNPHAKVAYSSVFRRKGKTSTRI